VILTGSSGYLGRKVRSALEELNHIVIPVDINDPDEPLDLRVEGSLKNLQAEGPYKLVHLAFPLPGKLNRKKFSKLVVEVNSNVIAELDPIETLVVSSTAVYGLEHPTDEESAVGPWEIYGKLKYETELAFKEDFKNVTIFRPGTLIEETRISTMASYIRFIQRSKLFAVPGNGRLIHPFTHTDDLVDSIVSWVDSENPGKRDYLALATHPKTLLEISSMRLDSGRYRICIPKFLLRLIGSDSFPIANISRWHFSALTYDFESYLGNYPLSQFRSYEEIFRQ
jgi:nucleoside-diphosphate-sugar epimerase